MKQACGIDISEHNGSFSFAKAQQNRAVIQFLIIRASRGPFQDKKFDQFLKQSASIPIIGAYHYFTYATHWKEQADKFLKQVEGKPLQFYALDYEKRIGAPKEENDYVSKNAEGANQWLQYVSQSAGKPTLFYTNPSIYNELRKLGHNWMDEWPLWIANYNKSLNLPGGVSDWKFWQYSADENRLGNTYGLDSQSVDLNYFNGALEDLYRWLGFQDTKGTGNSTMSELNSSSYSWRDVIEAAKQVDEKMFGRWLNQAGILDKVDNDHSLLDKPYSGPPIVAWQITPDRREDILKIVDAHWRHGNANLRNSTWRDVIGATKQVDGEMYGRWLNEAGVLDKVTNDQRLLDEPYAGLPIAEWPIELDKRWAILNLLTTKSTERTAAPAISTQSQAIKLSVPFLSQWDPHEANLHDADCGPTCMAMILRAQGANGSPPAKTVTVNDLYQRHLQHILDTKDRKKYTQLPELVTIGNKEGLKTGRNQYKETREALAGLRERISEGKPFIALINYAMWDHFVNLGFSFSGNHYVVVTGFDADHVYVHDPLFPAVKGSKGEFYQWTNERFLTGWGKIDPPDKHPNLNFAYVYTDKVVQRL
jgi:GH25 family lysozyme M1 (1,4-beta-N-acetylmuramidase)/uncharacterized protein YvpB